MPEHSEGSLTDVPALFGGNFQSGELAPALAGAYISLVIKSSQCRSEDVRLPEHDWQSVFRAHTRSDRLRGRLTRGHCQQIKIKGSLRGHARNCGEQARPGTHQPSFVPRGRSGSNYRWYGCSCRVANGIYPHYSSCEISVFPRNQRLEAHKHESSIPEFMLNC